MVLSVRYLAVGRILGAHGVRGEVKVQIHTDFPERFQPEQQLYLEMSGEWQPVTVLACRFHQANALLLLQGYGDRTVSQTLRGQWLYIPIEEAAPLDEDEFYEHEVIGAVVETCSGEVLGQVREVLFTGANEVFVVSGGAKDILLPVLKDVVLEIDRARHRITVEVPPGLLDDR